jgi:hypothetical protein
MNAMFAAVMSIAAMVAGTTPLEPWSKRDWLQDGPAVVYDAIGSPETVETSPQLLNTGVAKHSMEHYFDFVAAGLDLTPVITHRFPLEHWTRPCVHSRTRAVTVLLDLS